MNNTHDFFDEAKAHQSIHHFEEKYHDQNEQYSAQPMVKKWSDNEEIIYRKALPYTTYDI